MKAPIILIGAFASLGLFDSTRASVSIPLSVQIDGRTSLAIYDQDGRMVRTLLTGRPMPKGDHAVTWDGRDRYGDALPAGDYTWKMLATEGLRSEFITQVGQNVDPVWERTTGNHQAPNAVAVDATGLYRVGAVNEGAHWGVKTDLDGRHLWTSDRGAKDPWVQETAAVTLVGERLFELMPNGDVYGYDARTGRVFTGGDHDPKPWMLRWEGFQPPPDVKDEQRRRLNAEQSPRDLAGDAANGLLVAAYPQHDALAWFSAKNGKWVDQVNGLARLAGVAVAKDGTVFAISQGAVVALTPERKTPREVIPAARLQGPWRLCVSATSGEIFVAENSELASRGQSGSRHHQVKRFSAEGALLKTYGQPEGRSDGAYVPTDFRGLTDIEADHEGGFVVTEGRAQPPRRSARFNAEGNLVREWYGAQHYGVIAYPEPNDPRHVWFRANADKPGLVRCEVDYAAKSWRVVEVYQDVFGANEFAETPMVPYLFAHGGRIYIHGGGVQPSGLSLSIYDPVTRRIRPCNASGKHNNRAYLWNDLNDDGLASDDEIQWLNRNKLGGSVMPSDLTLLTTSTASDYSPGPVLKPSRFTPGGTPIYRFSEATKYEPWAENGWKKYPGDFRQATDGSWFGCFADGASNPHEGAESHGAWYYNSCSALDRLVKWDKDWKPLWSVGRHSPDNDHETGSTAMARGLVGLAHGCIVWGDASDEETCRPTVWTEDGLYVDELLRVPVDHLPKEKHGEDNTNEYPQGHLYTNPTTGETFFYALNSGGGAPIYRITGWNGWQRAEGRITLAAAATRAAKHDGTGLKAEYFNNADCSGEPALTRTDKLIYFNWGKAAPDKAITADTFSVRWTGTYEAATSEDTRFEIRGNFPWRDKGQPLWSRLWLGGELVFDSKPQQEKPDSTFGAVERSSVGSVRVKLQAGERLGLRMECGFKKGEAAIALNHDTPGLDRRAVLPAFLHPEPGPERRLEFPVQRRPELIAEFSFEEKAGALSWSKAGGDVFGRLTGSTRRVPGKTGSAIELEARGEFDPALFPIDEELRLPDTDYTVDFWFQTTAKDVRLCEAKRYSSYNNRWSDHVIALTGGKLQFRLQGDDPLEATGALNDGRWHHVVTTVGSGGQRLHVDGRLIATGKLARRTRTSNRLGLDLGPGRGNGVVAVDEVKVFGRALTAAELDGGNP